VGYQLAGQWVIVRMDGTQRIVFSSDRAVRRAGVESGRERAGQLDEQRQPRSKITAGNASHYGSTL